jgi:hypothetical protein
MGDMTIIPLPGKDARDREEYPAHRDLGKVEGTIRRSAEIHEQ